MSKLHRLKQIAKYGWRHAGQISQEFFRVQNVKECINNGTIQPGMKVMCCGFGVGLSWGGVILSFR